MGEKDLLPLSTSARPKHGRSRAFYALLVSCAILLVYFLMTVTATTEITSHTPEAEVLTPAAVAASHPAMAQTVTAAATAAPPSAAPEVHTASAATASANIDL